MKRSTLVRAALAAAVGLSCASAALVAQEKGGGENVLLEIKRPRPGYVGTPKEPPAGLRFDPKWQPGKHPVVRVPKEAKNLALNKAVTSSDMEPTIGKLDEGTDGENESNEG